MPGFEIAGYGKPLLDAFSTRRRELLDYMQDRGWENTPATGAAGGALYAASQGRAGPPGPARASWQERAQELGPARDSGRGARGRNGIEAHRRPLCPAAANAQPSALSVVRQAVEHLEERRTVISGQRPARLGTGARGRPALARSAGRRHCPAPTRRAPARSDGAEGRPGLRHRQGAQRRARYHRQACARA